MWKRERVKTILASAGTAVLIYSGLLAIFGERAVPTVFAQQQDPFLSRRIDGLEQRFYSIESRLNRIEQQSRPVGIAPRITDTSEAAIQFLRSQLDSMRLRVGEVECGLLRVDERTLTAAARAARNKLGSRDSDKCRVDTGTPIQLSARP